ncbi:MAG: hypothetical protein AAF437_16500 [Pseudomonadota bacterium]
MGDVIGIATSAAGGGLFGLFGTALGRIAGYFEKQQSIAHEERRWAHQTALVQLEQAADAQRAETALAQAHADGSWSGLSASLQADARLAASYQWVNAVRALTRPTLTMLLWLIAAMIWFSADPAERSNIVGTATFAATAATLWWFGDRAAPGQRSA